MDFIIIYGPTGVGKTALALELGKHLPIEIINADMGQMYGPLTIGTAKPQWRQEPLPHHLFDILNEPINYSAHAYRVACLELIGAVKKRGRIPVIVGGTGFYLKSLFFDLGQAQSLCKTNADTLTQSDKARTSALSWELLAAIDPVRAEAIHPQDRYRIERALAIWHSTGILPSQARPVLAPTGRCLLLFLDRQKEDLVERIDERIKLMLNDGWIEEVIALPPQWEDLLNKKGFMGYRDILRYLKEGCSDKAALAVTIKKQTWTYVRRQRIFWRSFKKALLPAIDSKEVMVQEVNLTQVPADVSVKQLLEKIRDVCLLNG